MKANANVEPRVEIREVWVTVANDELDMDEAVNELAELGNEIVEVDYVNRRIKIYGGEQ